MHRPPFHRDTGTLAAFALFAVTGLGCDHFYGVHGRVTSCADHRPLSEAQTRLHLSEDDHGEERVEPDGKFSVVLNHPRTIEEATLTVSAPGHEPVERKVRPSEAGEEICLQPAVGP